MNNKIQMTAVAIMVALWLNGAGIGCHGQSTTMTGSNNAPVSADTVAVTTGDSVTLATTSNTGSVSISYDFSSSPGVSGPTTATAGPGSPANSLFSFSSDASGNANSIVVNITPISSGACASTSTFTAVVPKVSFGNITNVPSFASYQRVPIYGGPNALQGIAYVTITPNFLPTGTKILCTVNNTGGGSGSAAFDDNTFHHDLTQSDNLKIRGRFNSTLADNMEIDAYLDDNLNDQLIDDNNLQSILLFTVSTWPTNIACTMLTGYGGANGSVGFIVGVTSDSESGDVDDLDNCSFDEKLTVNPWTSPPFLGVFAFNPTRQNPQGILVQNSGGVIEFPSSPLDCTGLATEGGNYPTTDRHIFPVSNVYGSGNGSVVINQQYEFEDVVLGTTMMPWQGAGQGQFTITNTVSTNTVTGTRQLTVEETGNGLNPPAFDGTVIQ